MKSFKQYAARYYHWGTAFPTFRQGAKNYARLKAYLTLKKYVRRKMAARKKARRFYNLRSRETRGRNYKR